MLEEAVNPVDPALKPSAWERLRELRDGLNVDFRQWFAADPDRAQRHSYQAADLFVDMSKTYDR